MAYKCFKIGQDISSCPQRIEDGHCYYCPLYQEDSPSFEVSDEKKENGLEAIIKAAEVALMKG